MAEAVYTDRVGQKDACLARRELTIPQNGSTENNFWGKRWLEIGDMARRQTFRTEVLYKG